MAEALPNPGIVHDIDGNASDTHGYWFEAFYNEGFALPSGYSSLEEVVSKFRLPKDVPGWWGPDGQRFNDTLLVSKEAHTGFQSIPGSEAAIHRLHARYGTAMYLTGRDSILQQVTVDWLFDNNRFPRAPVQLRPEGVSISDTHVWKAGILVEHADTIVGITEDSHGVAEALPDSWPGFICLLGYSEDEIKGLHPNAFACEDWSQIETAIDSFMNRRL